VRKLILLFAVVILIGLPTVAAADVVTFQAPATGANQGLGGPKQFDLDHHNAYAWRIGGVDLPLPNGGEETNSFSTNLIGILDGCH
jgi:hypothetical protein